MRRPHQFVSTGATSYTMPVKFDPLDVEVVVNRVTVYDGCWYSIIDKTLTFTNHVPDANAIIRVTGEVTR